MSYDFTVPQSGDDERQARELSLRHTRPPTQIPGYDLTRFLGSGAYGEVWIGLVYEFQKDLMTYLSLVVACALIRTIRERRQQQLDELELRRALSEARLAHLSAQIEPHFVFNTLNAISNRIYEDVPAADRMIVATGLADRQIQAMASHVEEALEKEGVKRIRSETSPDWVLLDAGDLVIHLFKPEARETYAIERMWGPHSPGEEEASPVGEEG